MNSATNQKNLSQLRILVSRLNRISTKRQTGLRVRVTRGRKNPLCLGFPGRFKAMRLALGLSHVALAAHCGFRQSTVSRHEAGLIMPGLETLEQYALAFGVSPIWLAYGREGYEPFQQKRPRTDAEVVPQPVLTPIEAGPSRYRGCSKRLASERAKQGLSIKKLERRATIGERAIICTERGQTTPAIDTNEAIAKALGVAPGILAWGPDKKKVA